MTEPSSGQQVAQDQRDMQNSELFMALVVQLTQMALIALGREKLQDGTRPSVDLEVGQFYIDTLEMLEQKTRGNLGPVEHDFLTRQLTTLRMCFVEAVESGVSSAKPAEAPPASAPKPQETDAGQTAGSEESKKRFVKKYGAEGDSASHGS
ncbi:MAG: DUF1844 domain-containing protein [Verrucomicrobiota bacterium]|nr:DUF1844 domain-containing protein [Verrucomicrobiota bacterium]